MKSIYLGLCVFQDLYIWEEKIGLSLRATDRMSENNTLLVWGLLPKPQYVI